jgi:osmotically-inducible protein OsmY
MVTVLFRTAVAAGLLAAVGAGASQVPATYHAEVGKRIEIRVPDAPPPGAIEAAVKSIESGAQAGKREIQVRVRVTREPGAGALVRIDAFGDTIGMDGIPAAIRAAAPAFANAEIAVQPVEGKVEGDVGTLIGNKVLGDRLSDAQVEEAVRRSLADEGLKGNDVQVDVTSDDSEGQIRRQIRVIVGKEEEPATPR